MSDFKPKSFWKRPEGITGAVVLALLLFGGGYLVMGSLGAIISFATGSTFGTVASLMALAAVVFMALDSKTRTLVSYMYKSAMRAITGLFVKIDP